ncbi:MAG: S8 family serine peptidase, partial [bacterium]|nr:S8 family serine peptidase [bacterium]
VGTFDKKVFEPGVTLRCAVDNNNALRIFDTKARMFFAETGHYGDKAGLSGDQIRFVRVGGYLAAMDDTGRTNFYSNDGDLLKVDRLTYGFDSHWQIAGGTQGILAADSFGTFEIRVADDLSWERIQIPATPCEEKQLCGLSYAEDGSWFIVGYWGAYHGFGRKYVRVPIYNLPGKFAGVGAAHTGNGGKFLFFGPDNGDRGLLPEIPEWESRLNNQANNADARSFVWTKQAPPKHYNLLGKVEVSRGRELYLSIKPQIEPMIEVNGIIASEESKVFNIDPMKAWEGGQREPQDRWWIKAMKLDEARDLAETSNITPEKVRVGVVDTGFDMSHPYKPVAFWKNPNEVANNGIDDDKNGLVDDIYGYDFVNEDNEPDDENGHGTHVTGVIAGYNADTGDLFGVADNAEIIVAKVFNKKGLGNSIDLARAIIYLSQTGVEVVNCSWGGGSKSLGLEDAFRILNKTGAKVLSSSGNSSFDTDEYPQIPLIYPGVTGIGATTVRGRLADYSNYGKSSVKLLYPGSKIFSTVPGGGFDDMSGTSMASGIASGTYAWFLGFQKAHMIDSGASIDSKEQSDLAHSKVLDSFCKSALDKPEWASECGRIDLYGAWLQLWPQN